jgi:hypothetical protein
MKARVSDNQQVSSTVDARPRPTPPGDETTDTKPVRLRQDVTANRPNRSWLSRLTSPARGGSWPVPGSCYGNYCKRSSVRPLIAQLFDRPEQDRCLAHGDLAQEVGAEPVEALMSQAVTSRIRAAGGGHRPGRVRAGLGALLIRAAGGAYSGRPPEFASGALVSDEPKEPLWCRRIWHAIWHGKRKTGCDGRDLLRRGHKALQ